MGVDRKQLERSVKFAAPGVSDSDANAIAAEIMQSYDISPRVPPAVETVQQAAERGFRGDSRVHPGGPR